MKNNVEYVAAKELAIKYIGISKKTCNEVRQKLSRKQIQDETIDKVIVDLQEIQYLNDEMYAELYIKQELKKEVKSEKEIEIFLIEKGISRQIVAEEIEKIPSDYEKNVIDRLEKTKLLKMEDLKKNQYLYRRGFKISDRESF